MYTSRKIETTRPSDAEQRLYDGDGLVLIIRPAQHDQNGKALRPSRWWRLKYRYEGKDKMISFGTYPEVSLEEARKRRAKARGMLAKGINPSEERQKAKREVVVDQTGEELMFEVVARNWCKKSRSGWEENYYRTVVGRLEKDALPVIGRMSIREITPQHVLKALRIIEDRGAIESAHRVRLHISQVFDYAIITGLTEVNPAARLSRALQTPKVRHMPAVTDRAKLFHLLRDIDGYKGSYVTKCALRLSVMLFVRPGELRQAKWDDIDLEDAMWNLPATELKLKKAEKARRKGQVHTVPLAKQAVEILSDLKLFTGKDTYVFAGRKNRPMSNNTINSALRSMGWDGDTVTGHGFRATARTILDEELGWRVDLIEHQLAHVVKDPNGRAYNRTTFLAERRAMMQAWGDYLAGLKVGMDGQVKTDS
ncbi:MAG: tyrosine-type recombinase/integrase [Chlorobiaceae bacterium]|nr:tyrosine-type recombinase/integrase [Chlorobiaceae bacterium]